MQSLRLTYSGLPGGQHLTFKPTLLAALLASGVGTYLYLDLPAGGSRPALETGQTAGKSGFDPSFYGAARAAEPQLQARFVRTGVSTGIDQPGIQLTDAGLEHAAFVSAMRLDEPVRPLQRLRPQSGQTSAGRDPDLATEVQEPASAELGAVASQPVPTAPEMPGGLAVPLVPTPADVQLAEMTADASLAMASAVPPPQSQPSARVDAGADLAVLRRDLAAEAARGSEPIAPSQPVPVAPLATAAAPVATSPMLASTEAAIKTDAGASGAASNRLVAVSPPALAVQASAPAVTAPESALPQPVAALAPPARVVPVATAEPVAGPAALSEAPQPLKAAPIVLQPIKFKLAPRTNAGTASKGPASARQSGRAGLAAPSQSHIAGSPKQTRLPDRVVGDFIFHQVSVRLNDSPAGRMDVRIGGDASLAIRVGALLSVVEGRLDPDLFAALSRSAGADAYVSFRDLRAAGIDVRYDPAGDTIVLTAD